MRGADHGQGVGESEGFEDRVAVPLGGSDVGLLVVGVLLDGCGVGPGLAGDGDGGVPVLAGLVPAGDVPGDDGLDVPADAGAVLLPGAGGPRICSICRSNCCSRARISARLNDLMCLPNSRTCAHRAASRAAVEPWGTAGNERSSWIAIAAVRQLMQL